MRKMTCLLLVLLLLAGLTGCQENKTDASEQSAPVESVSAEGSISFLETESEPEPEPTYLTVEDCAALPAGTVLKAEELPPDGVSNFFYSETISDKVFKRMKGVSYRKGCPVKRQELRYVRVLHRGFGGETHIGELVCNKMIAEDMVEVFKLLYEKEYPIEKMLLVDEYGGDDEASMEDNNTSCFNFRPISGTSTLSNHAYGLAIDINPLYNPYITPDGYEPKNAGDYIDRTEDTPYKITSDDPCYLAFAERDYEWGGWWSEVQDYQHFEK